MFHLAPVGLTSTHRVDKCDHYNIQHNVAVAVRDICDTSYRQKIAYNLLHPDTKALLKNLDAFFAHGFNRMDKCYWCFVREFIPLSEQEDIRLRWKCNRTRTLSVAWLKDSLNKCTLYFQILAFRNAASLKAKWYNKNACLRNQKVLAKICDLVEKLEFVEFDIETPYELRTEDTPIAVPIAITGSGANNGSVASSSSNDYFASGSADVVVRRGHHKLNAEPRLRRDRIGGAFCSANSFVELSENNAHLSALTENLAEVDLSSTANDSDGQFLSTARDQNFIIDELVESYRKRVNGYLQSKDEEQSTSSHHLNLSYANNAGLVTEAADDEGSELTFEMRKFDVAQENDVVVEGMAEMTPEKQEMNNEDKADISLSEKKTPEMDYSTDSPSARFAELDSNEQVGSTAGGNVAESSGLSDFEDADEFITGEIPLDSGDIVQLAMEVFRGDGERFQRLFQVYVGHCAGQPTLRYLAVTDQYLYLLSTTNSSTANDASDAIDFRASSFGDAAGAPTAAASSFVVGSVGGFRSAVGNPGDYRYGMMKYIAHTTLKLADVDCLTVGIDAQVLCVHMKKLKLLTTNESRTNLYNSAGDSALAKDGDGVSSDQLRIFVIETACRELTKLVIRTVQQVAGNSLGARLPVFTHSTQLSIIAKRLLRQELGLSNVEVLHHSLVYWMEEVVASTGGKSDRSSAAKLNEPVNRSLEGYLHVRGVNTKSWVKRAGEWQYSYFVFKGFMLYQFSDSTCKFAQKSYNVREKVTQVFEADLKSDGELGFQMELDENCVECATGGMKALQFKCLSRSDVNKWIQNISLALSVSEMSGGLPIASMLFITADNLILAQEGANCIVDGFMRALNNVARWAISRVYVVQTEFHNVAVLERNGSAEVEDGRVVFEWIFLRDERELKRLLMTLDARWSVRVEDDEDRAADPATFNRIFNECAKMSSGDLWTSVCGR